MESPIRFVIITVSDRCSAGETVDKSGPGLKSKIESDKLGTVIELKCIPDDQHRIEIELIVASQYADVILTTGGTGLSPRDVTPQATKAVIQQKLPAFSFAMTLASLSKTKHAILSRSVCGVRGSCIIINLPGSIKGSIECFEAVCSTLRHAVDLLRGSDTRREHGEQTQIRKSKVELGKAASRDRESTWPLLSVEEAQNKIFENLPEPILQTVTLSVSSVGQVVGEDIIASEPLPPYRASIKDGYAVLTEDGAGIRQLKKAVTAGMVPDLENLQNGECVRVNTGGPVPPNGNAVVQVEDTKLVKTNYEGEEELIEILVAPKINQDIRNIGSDIPQGEIVVRKGEVISSIELGLLAAVGANHFLTYKLPRVGVLSTGNEIVESGTSTRPGAIRDSNRITLLSLLKQNNFPTIDLGIVGDEPTAILNRLENGLKSCDVLLSTGGVSMGEHDFLKAVLTQDLQATIHFGRVNIKPGKPTTFATCQWNGTKKSLFCLPGNPVSATVTFHLFVLPALLAIAGHPSSQRFPTIITAKMGFNITKFDTRPEYRRVVLDWNQEDGIPLAKSTGDQISSRLMSWREANGLLILPSSLEFCGNFESGRLVKTMVISKI